MDKEEVKHLLKTHEVTGSLTLLAVEEQSSLL